MKAMLIPLTALLHADLAALNTAERIGARRRSRAVALL